jgi:hypothetical protein
MDVCTPFQLIHSCVCSIDLLNSRQNKVKAKQSKDGKQ